RAVVRASLCFFFSSRRRHTSFSRDWSSDVCSSDLADPESPLLNYETRCPCGVHYCRITPEGLLTPCPYMPVVAGDLRESSFGHEIGRASCRERVSATVAGGA